jgi:hypothetical protein
MAPNFAELVKPVDMDRFRFALGVYGAAAEMKGPYDNPQTFALNLVDGDGSTSCIRFTDIPENRGMLAVKKEFPDPDEFHSLMCRIWMVPDVVRNPKLTKMGLVRRDSEGNPEIHDAIINALASAPFRKSGKLDKAAFFALVKSEQDRIETGESGGLTTA